MKISTQLTTQPFEISVAPMMEWTDRHCRYLMRLCSKHILLYTEMVHVGAILFGDRQRFLQYNTEEHPLALQLGGNDPKQLALAAKIAEEYGYDEINLNVGCPSARVQSGAFGACLMAEPQLVAECVFQMQQVVQIPVTVKTRIGIDNQDSYEFLYNFIKTVSASGVKKFIIHARKAWLHGLSPKQNREIPPINYDRVFAIKRNFPSISIILNGGLTTWQQCLDVKNQCDGVMVGRFAYYDPFQLTQVDELFFNQKRHMSRMDIMHAYLDYIQQQQRQGVPLKTVTKHCLNLFKGEPGAKHWRAALSQHSVQKPLSIATLYQSLQQIL